MLEIKLQLSSLLNSITMALVHGVSLLLGHPSLLVSSTFDLIFHVIVSIDLLVYLNLLSLTVQNIQLRLYVEFLFFLIIIYH